MTPKEKADEMINSFKFTGIHKWHCASVAVEKIIENNSTSYAKNAFWIEVLEIILNAKHKMKDLIEKRL